MQSDHPTPPPDWPALTPITDMPHAVFLFLLLLLLLAASVALRCVAAAVHSDGLLLSDADTEHIH